MSPYGGLPSAISNAVIPIAYALITYTCITANYKAVTILIIVV